MQSLFTTLHSDALLPKGGCNVASIEAHDPGGKVRHAVAAEWDCAAEFSDCGRYRYSLRRRWAEGALVLFILTNPSIATIEVNDPTVAKCCRYARKWGYGGVLIGNVAAYRSTSPQALTEVADPIGPDNKEALLRMAEEADLIVIAHGRLPSVKLQRHANATVKLLRDAGHGLSVLAFGKLGLPKHPLYLSESLQPVVWS